MAPEHILNSLDLGLSSTMTNSLKLVIHSLYCWIWNFNYSMSVGSMDSEVVSNLYKLLGSIGCCSASLQLVTHNILLKFYMMGNTAA